MKRIAVLVCTIALISCTHAQKNNNDFSKTKIVYGAFDIEIPTKMLAKATVTSSDGPLIVLEDRRNLSINIIHADDAASGCSKDSIADKDFKKVTAELVGHTMEGAFIQSAQDLACAEYDTPIKTYHDNSSKKLIYTRCRAKTCETLAVFKEDQGTEQMLLLLSEGFEWGWIKETLKGS